MSESKVGLLPVIFRKGRKVNLRPLDESDLPLLLRWANDQEVRQFYIRHRPTTAALEKKLLEKKLLDESSEVNLGITLAENHELIGTMSLHRIDLIHGTGWVGIMIGRKDCWSNGFGSEATMILLDYAFNQLNLRKVSWGALSSNSRSLRCAGNCGFREEGRMRAQFQRGDELIDDVFLSVFRNEWLPFWQAYQNQSF